MNNKSSKGFDNYEVNFDIKDTKQDFLNELNSFVIDRPAYDISGEINNERIQNVMLSTKEQILFSPLKDKINIPSDSPLVEEAELFLRVDYVDDNGLLQTIVYPIDKNAENSLCSRIKIYGENFSTLKPSTKCFITNEIFMAGKFNRVRLIIIDGKVRAIMSAPEIKKGKLYHKAYGVIDSNDFFKKVTDYAESEYKNVTFVEAGISYHKQFMKLYFPSHKLILHDLYKDIKGDMIDEEFIPGMMILTSETGYCSASVFGFWENNGQLILMNDIEKSVKAKHSGYVNVDKIIEKLPNIFQRFLDTIELIKKQSQVKLSKDDIEAVIRDVSEQVQDVGKKKINELINLATTSTREEWSGYDVTKLFMDNIKIDEDDSMTRKLKIQYLYGCLFNVNYEKVIQRIKDKI